MISSLQHFGHFSVVLHKLLMLFCWIWNMFSENTRSTFSIEINCSSFKKNAEFIVPSKHKILCFEGKWLMPLAWVLASRLCRSTSSLCSKILVGFKIEGFYLVEVHKMLSPSPPLTIVLDLKITICKLFDTFGPFCKKCVCFRGPWPIKGHWGASKPRAVSGPYFDIPWPHCQPGQISMVS